MCTCHPQHCPSFCEFSMCHSCLYTVANLCLSLPTFQEALELMKKIPKEANNIICMSLIKGVSRASIISHGTLWIQVCHFDCLFFPLPLLSLSPSLPPSLPLPLLSLSLSLPPPPSLFSIRPLNDDASSPLSSRWVRPCQSVGVK